MPWLTIYVTVALSVLAVATLCCARDLRGDLLRAVAIAAAAALWPVLVVGLVQFACIQAIAAYIKRRNTVIQEPAPVPAEAVTVPTELVQSLARLAQQIGATRPA